MYWKLFVRCVDDCCRVVYILLRHRSEVETGNPGSAGGFDNSDVLLRGSLTPRFPLVKKTGGGCWGFTTVLVTKTIRLSEWVTPGGTAIPSMTSLKDGDLQHSSALAQSPKGDIEPDIKKTDNPLALYTLRKAVCKGYVGQPCKLRVDWLIRNVGCDWATAIFISIVL